MSEDVEGCSLHQGSSLKASKLSSWITLGGTTIRVLPLFLQSSDCLSSSTMHGIMIVLWILIGLPLSMSMTTTRGLRCPLKMKFVRAER
mmetsp:Transcript_13979/g.48264  ORF Transcript_13979/g.48264 Transcript_13979/m.48264 type:complete len:89 (-) Transcript_13979:210-476(-)